MLRLRGAIRRNSAVVRQCRRARDLGEHGQQLARRRPSLGLGKQARERSAEPRRVALLVPRATVSQRLDPGARSARQYVSGGRPVQRERVQLLQAGQDLVQEPGFHASSAPVRRAPAACATARPRLAGGSGGW